MASITGLYSKNEKTININRVTGSLSKMILRGGNQVNYYQKDNICIGLSSKNRELPYKSMYQNSNYCIGIDGEIFNFPQLKIEYGLNNIGELIFFLYQKFGYSFLNYLEGGFSLVLYDELKKELLLTRDNFGRKPLYYTLSESMFAFSSELNGVLFYNEVKKEVNLRGIDNYFTNMYVNDNETIFSNIYKIKPNELVIFNKQGKIKTLNPKSNFNLEISLDNENILINKIDTRILQALNSQVSGKQRIGYLLSGGVDTATLVGYGKQLNSDITTITLGFPDSKLTDERNEARLTSQHFQTKHTEVLVDYNCIDNFNKLTRHYGFPIHPSAIISYSMFEQITGKVDYVICGDGGNEIFGGVYKYNQLQNYVLGLNNSNHILTNLVQSLGQNMWYRFNDTRLRGVVMKIADLYFSMISKVNKKNTKLSKSNFDSSVIYYSILESLFDISIKNKLYSNLMQDALKGVNSLNFIQSLFSMENNNVLQQVPQVRAMSFIPYRAIPYIEYNAISNEIEPLFPFLDKKLIKLMYSTPYPYLYGKKPRYIMEKAVSGKIPVKFFSRNHKGFSPPINDWLKTPKWKEYVFDYLNDDMLKKSGFFSHIYVNKLLNDFYNGNKIIESNNKVKKQQIGSLIWMLLSFQVWYDEYFGL